MTVTSVNLSDKLTGTDDKDWPLVPRENFSYVIQLTEWTCGQRNKDRSDQL